MWPQRWLTPVSGLSLAVASPSLTPTPTRRQPTRPGPRVTARRSRSNGLTAALSRDRSRRAGRSGTTPPNSLCTSTWEWMTLARTLRPSSTTATEVSSQLVSMPRVRAMTKPSDSPDEAAPTRLPTPDSPDYPGWLLVLFGEELAAKAAHLGIDPVEVHLVRLAKARRVDGVRPHHDRVLAVVRVVALAAADDLEAEALVHLHGVVVGGPDLERHPLGAHVVCRLDQAREDDPSVTPVLQVLADADGRHVSLVVHAPHAAVADDRGVEVRQAVALRPVRGTLLPQHDVVGARPRRELAVVGVPWPGRREDLALDLLDRVDVSLTHELERELLPDLNHLLLSRRRKRLHVFDLEITIRHFACCLEHLDGRLAERPELAVPLETVAGRRESLVALHPSHKLVVAGDVAGLAQCHRPPGHQVEKPPSARVDDSGHRLFAAGGLEV